MEGFEEKLESILSNPQMMQQIMSMAQSFGPAQSQPQQEIPFAFNPPDIDPAAVQKIMGLATQMNVDPNQQALLGALRPYLATDRIRKLEKAMRAAKLASIASGALNSGALSFLTGR